MKKIIPVILSLVLTACATPPAASLQAQQVQYVQACSAYGVAFSAALQMHIDGKLNLAQVNQVTILDSQITPICTGPLPVNPAVVTQQITAAIASLAIIETAQKAIKP